MNIHISDQDSGFQKWGLIGTITWGVLIGIVFVVTQIITVFAYIALNHADTASSEMQKLIQELQYNGTIISIATTLTLVICLSIILGVIKLKKGSNIKDYLALRFIDLKALRLWLPVTILFIILFDATSILLGHPIVPEFMSSAYFSAGSTLLFWFAIVVAAPVFEEVFFRGFLYSGFESSVLGPIGAIIITSLMWAAIHTQYEMYIVIWIFIMGIGLGIARMKTKSILLPIGMHSFANMVATIETAMIIT